MRLGIIAIAVLCSVPILALVRHRVEMATRQPSAPLHVVAAVASDTLLTIDDLRSTASSIETQFPRQYLTFTSQRLLLDKMIQFEQLYLMSDKGSDRQRSVERLISERIEKEFAPVTSEEIAAFYAQNWKQYDTIRARHILIRPDTADKEKAARLLKQVLANPAQFEALATENSEDPGSRSKGGDVGWFSYGRMVAPFSEAAFSLKENLAIYPALVQTQFGSHIIQLLEQKRGLVFYQNEIATRMTRERKTRIFERLGKEAQSRFPAIQYDDNLRAHFKLPELPPEEMKLMKDLFDRDLNAARSSAHVQKN